MTESDGELRHRALERRRLIEGGESTLFVKAGLPIAVRDYPERPGESAGYRNTVSEADIRYKEQHSKKKDERRGDEEEMDVDPGKWETFQKKINSKRKAEEENKPGSSVRAKPDQPHGDKRRMEVDDSEGAKPKVTRISNVMMQQAHPNERKLSKLEEQMQRQLLSLNGVDITEVYSPERVNAYASEYGLTAGTSMDLTTRDHDGRAWNFDEQEMRERAWERIKKEKPMCVIGSPMCTNFSILMNVNWKKMSREEINERWSKAVMHLEFCASLYRLQIDEGRYFLHEHPLSATSWKLPCIENLMSDMRVIRTKAHMCARTAWNQPTIKAQALCTNRLGL